MDPLLGGLITGGANLLGSLFSSQTSAQNTQQQIAASEAEQAAQNSFTEQMSNTAYQRASADMKAAGLNPAMMFGSGSAASTPSGSSIQAPMPQTQSKFAGLGHAAESTVNTAIQAKTFDKMTQEIANLQTEQAKTAAQTATELERPEEVRSAAWLRRQEAASTGKDIVRKENEMPVSRVAGLSAGAIESMPPWLRDNAIRAGFVGSKASDILAPFMGTARGVGGLVKQSQDNAFRNRFYFGE